MKKVISIKDFSFRIGKKQILSDINLDINKGEIIALVGESGCGKTTLGRWMVDYFNIIGTKFIPDGDIYYHNNDTSYSILSEEYKKVFQVPPVQMIFQDPKTALNLKMNIHDQLIECLSQSKTDLDIHKESIKIAKKYKIAEYLDKTPQNISGGQRRRVGIAKIICCLNIIGDCNKVVIADEPVASLDASIKLDIMDRIIELNEEGYTIVIISHDINLITRHADRVIVMSKSRFNSELNKEQRGLIVENWIPGTEPKEPETKKLIEDSLEINQYLDQLDR